MPDACTDTLARNKRPNHPDAMLGFRPWQPIVYKYILGINARN